MVDLGAFNSVSSNGSGGDDPVDLDDFDKIMDEAEQASKDSLALLEQMSQENLQEMMSRVNVGVEELTPGMLKALREGDEVYVFDGSGDKRYQRMVRRSRREDKRHAKRLGFFGRTVLDKHACEFQAAQRAFEHLGAKPRWAVDGCVVLRDQGMCVVCGEKLSTGYEVKMVVPSKLGGQYEEGNCVCVCKECAKCWFPQRLWDRGLGKQDMLQALSVAVMNRRAKEYKGCKWLTEKARVRLKELEKEVGYREAQVHETALKHQLILSSRVESDQ